MKKIKDILCDEIENKFINWDKLSTKIHAALSLVDNKFECIRNDPKDKRPIKMDDSLTLSVNRNGDKFCYKLIQPRFRNGDLYCHGLQIGRYDLKGKPYFLSPPLRY